MIQVQSRRTGVVREVTRNWLKLQGPGNEWEKIEPIEEPEFEEPKKPQPEPQASAEPEFETEDLENDTDFELMRLELEKHGIKPHGRIKNAETLKEKYPEILADY